MSLGADCRSHNSSTDLCVEGEASQLGGVTWFSVWKWPVSGEASDLYHQISAGSGMFSWSSFPLFIFLLLWVFPQLSITFLLSLIPTFLVAFLSSRDIFFSSRCLYSFALAADTQFILGSVLSFLEGAVCLPFFAAFLIVVVKNVWMSVRTTCQNKMFKVLHLIHVSNSNSRPVGKKWPADDFFA